MKFPSILELILSFITLSGAVIGLWTWRTRLRLKQVAAQRQRDAVDQQHASKEVEQRLGTLDAFAKQHVDLTSDVMRQYVDMTKSIVELLRTQIADLSQDVKTVTEEVSKVFALVDVFRGELTNHSRSMDRALHTLFGLFDSKTVVLSKRPGDATCTFRRPDPLVDEFQETPGSVSPHTT